MIFPKKIIGEATENIVLLEQCNLVPQFRQIICRGQARQTATDDGDIVGHSPLQIFNHSNRFKREAPFFKQMLQAHAVVHRHTILRNFSWDTANGHPRVAPELPQKRKLI
jgi:hypothetical protein